MPNAPALTLQKLLWRTLLKTRGVLVTYKATGFVIAELKVVFTRPGEDQVDMSDNFSLVSKQWDVLIDPATLINPTGTPIEPELGHVITKLDGTVYRVQSGDGSRNCWRWSDGLQTWRRTHTVID
ncbi:hypothetical protein [Aureliella helgolandensis]|uniref:Phage head-tail joining protein domain-containing protein n=1 Tax=Aureliella helgolandensis TaxID=2527968 RepID=A0A518GEB1_9BACT|nr:hypothetical protein [Aureliella helgolandensis]QDV26933.1 hypothetical protein Q31a_53130 [Aureliella helgolandensis]